MIRLSVSEKVHCDEPVVGGKVGELGVEDGGGRHPTVEEEDDGAIRVAAVGVVDVVGFEAEPGHGGSKCGESRCRSILERHEMWRCRSDRRPRIDLGKTGGENVSNATGQAPGTDLQRPLEKRGQLYTFLHGLVISQKGIGKLLLGKDLERILCLGSRVTAVSSFALSFHGNRSKMEIEVIAKTEKSGCRKLAKILRFG